MCKFYYLGILIGILTQGFAQTSIQKPPMEPEYWELPKGAYFENFNERRTLVIPQGKAFIKDLKLKNGTISVDVFANEKRSFAGLIFRSNRKHQEEVYMRLHKSKQVDALQYAPIFNDESNWQLFRESQAMTQYVKKGWNKLSITLKNEQAVVFVNRKRMLYIPYLYTNNSIGEIGLWALFTNRFSNFQVDRSEPNITFPNKKKSSTEKGTIKSWKLSPSMKFDSNSIKKNTLDSFRYSSVTTENSGLLLISKYRSKNKAGSFEENNEDFVIAKHVINTSERESQYFHFDYSDKIIIFLNGEEIFRGNNAFRSKGIQFMGHLNMNSNILKLELSKGKNTIHCVVIEKANGWGLQGKLSKKP